MKSEKGTPKTFYIGWNGTSDFQPVVATTGKQAKEKFANYHGVKMSLGIVLKRDVPDWIKRMKPIV
jgi:hypothetical protein